MKTFAQLSAVGIAAVLLLKLLGVIVVPLLGFLRRPSPLDSSSC